MTFRRLVCPLCIWMLLVGTAAAENELGEYCYSSPAISQGQIIFRGEKHLIAIGQ